MTTLSDIIRTIDERLMLAEQAQASTSRSHKILGVQEKMRKYVLVEIETEKLAIPIEGLAEIGPMPPIMPLPNLPPWIHGIVNQRGEIISVIDLGHLLQGGSVARTHGKKLAVLRSHSMKVGVCINQVIATVSKVESDRRQGRGTPLSLVAPEVFSDSLQVENVVYQILKPEALLGMDRLMQYYLPA